MSKIVTLKITVKDSHSPDAREYEETRRIDHGRLDLSGELQLVYDAMKIMKQYPMVEQPSLPGLGTTPQPKHKKIRKPRNKFGQPNIWESSDGRITPVRELHPPHARNIILDMHRQAVEANALHITQWCRDNYPQYDGILEQAKNDGRGGGA